MTGFLREAVIGSPYHECSELFSLRHGVLFAKVGRMSSNNSILPKCVQDVEPRGQRRGAWLTPERGDIPAKSWRIHPRPKAVAFCRRGKQIESSSKPFKMISRRFSHFYFI